MIWQADIIIKGRVQGVFFRDWAKIEAIRLGLAGWTRNEDDFNTVSVCVQGDKSRIEEFINLCRKGPPSSHVETVEAGWTDKPSVIFSGFEIRY